MAFNWGDKFTAVFEALPDEYYVPMLKAIMDYGTHGIVPELEFPLAPIFASLKDDIDYSQKQRESGRNGGRAKRVQNVVEPKVEKPKADTETVEAIEDVIEPETEVIEALEPTLAASEEVLEPLDVVLEAPSEVLEPQNNVVEAQNEAVEAPEKVLEALSEVLEPNTIQNNTEQNSTEKEKQPKGCLKKKTTTKFVKPSVDEVKAYAQSIGYDTLDAQKFVDYYETRGWKLNKGVTMKNWQAAVRTWRHNTPKQMPTVSISRGGAEDDEYADVLWG